MRRKRTKPNRGTPPRWETGYMCRKVDYGCGAWIAVKTDYSPTLPYEVECPACGMLLVQVFSSYPLSSEVAP
jgi:hypothetical protein